MGQKIIPVILAGGVGTRLWPLSRETFPKQFLRLISQYSLLQETVLRAQSLANIGQPIIVCNADHYFLSQDHLKEINVSGYRFILEPFGRNTAPAIACTAQWVLENIDHEAILLVLPSDHYIADQQLFFSAVEQAKSIAQQGYLVTFGVVPTQPETGYGYIQAGKHLATEAFYIDKFIEKPPLELAKKFVDSGNFYWNSGMFMFKPQTYLEELMRSAPDIYHSAVESVRQGEQNADYVRLDQEVFASCPNNSIDYAVMEKTLKGVVIPLASSWNDLGCWAAVAKAGTCDVDNNVIKGDVIIKDSKDCFVSSEGQMVAVLGLNNQVIVTTPDVVLVANKAYSQEVKHFVQQLKLDNSHLIAHHNKQYSSSGYIENLSAEDDFTIEHFMIKPYSELSLPGCTYPAHWLVVKGVAEILANNRHVALQMSHSLYMDRQLKCSIKNKSEYPLHLIRIQLKLSVQEEVMIA